MKDITQRALLFDFYGALLTEKQCMIYDLYFQQDLSLGEIGQTQGVSRQAVYDLLKRTEESLGNYENKLGLVKKFLDSREIIKGIRAEVKNLYRKSADIDLEKINFFLKELEDSW